MNVVAAGLVGFVRVAAPPTAGPADTEVRYTATTNMHLDDETKKQLKMSVQQKMAINRMHQAAAGGKEAGIPDPYAAKKAKQPVGQAPNSSAPQQVDQPQQVQQVQGMPPIRQVDRTQRMEPLRQTDRVRRTDQVRPPDADRSRVQRSEAPPADSTGLNAREIRARFRDVSGFSPVKGVPQGFMEQPLPWEV